MVARECVVSVVKVTPEGGDRPTFHATSFFELTGDKITAITEHWATDEQPPEWRRDRGWAERV